MNRNFSGILTCTPSTISPYHCLFPTSAISRTHKSIFNTILNSTKPTGHVVTRTIQNRHPPHMHTCICPKYQISCYLIYLHTSTYVHSPYPVHTISLVHTQRIKLKTRQSLQFEHSHSASCRRNTN